MDKKVYELSDAYRDEFVADLRRWIQVPSVKGEAAPGAPFGTEVRRMLDLAMADGERMGFPARNFDGYACDMTLGDKPETIAVLGHLDVVPAGDGWQVDPFGALVQDGKVFGRGTVLKVKPAAGDQIVEINFEKVGIKKTMANFAPLTKITEEE